MQLLNSEKQAEEEAENHKLSPEEIFSNMLLTEDNVKKLSAEVWAQ